ncbi:MAG: hypothetical protein A3J28_02760 [Acidobacteria bacterium RIFCSPLOWO2_12_FULL_60_22]|nr:MAG: hypothetical protein A3J28_02760 [Acidobacteria bacterium RIFCSPLOWO2_12_FULL_60_22]
MNAFLVRTDSHFERLAQSLRKHHRDFDANFIRALEIVKADPHNVSRTHPIKKLTDVKLGDGQYRIRLGRWRFRYDIYGQEVVLTYCGLRREETYR